MRNLKGAALSPCFHRGEFPVTLGAPMRVLRPSLLALLLASCESSPVTSAGDAATAPRDALPDALPDATDVPAAEGDARVEACPSQPAFAMGDDGAADPFAVTPGAARAGRLTAMNVPRGINALAEWRAGDYVLANERVALIVEADRPSSGYMPWGGMPLGVGRMVGGAFTQPADFGEVSFTLGRFAVGVERVSVLRDGRDGVAVVRAVGPMRAIPFIDEFARVIAPTDYGAIRAAVDYELRPGADHVDVFATFEVSETQGYMVRTALHAFFQAYRMPRFVPGEGFATSAVRARTLGWINDRVTSWAWQLSRAEDNLASFISTSGFDSFTAPPINLPPCAQTRVHVARIVAGGPGLDGLNEALARTASQRLRAVSGTVLSGGAPLADARVHATSMDGARYLSRALTDAQGRYTIHVPEATPVRLAAWHPGHAAGEAVAVDANGTSAALSLPASATLAVRATEDGAPVPVRVQVYGTPGTSVPAAPAPWGEESLSRGRVLAEFPTDGRVTAPIPPGRWRVVVSRGPAYEIVDQTITAVAGETVTVDAAMQRVIPRAGVLCGDFHIHTHRSADSEDDARLKVASGVADGLEVLARSEHEYVADFQGIIEEMGLTRHARGVGSIELTTFTWGHFGVFPLTPDPSRPNGGNFAWANRRPPEVFADVRNRPENPTLVINHPRGGMVAGSYFDAAGWDPTNRVSTRPDFWDDRFTAVEFFNDSSFEENAQRVNDWFSFLRAGRRVFAVGSSDSHAVNGSPVGYPRTCMFLGTDDPAAATPRAIGDAVGQGRSFISGGVWLDVSASPGGGGSATAGPGQELTGAGAEASLRIVARAPRWVRARNLEVYVDGSPLPAITLDESQRDPMDPTVRYRGAVRVPVSAQGSWAIVVVNGEELTPVFPGRRAFAVSNPIFLRR